MAAAPLTPPASGEGLTARPIRRLHLVGADPGHGQVGDDAPEEAEELAERVIRQVLRSGRDGTLPPFAATLGLTPTAFASLAEVLGLPAGTAAAPVSSADAEPPPFPYAELLAYIWRQRHRSDMLIWATAAAIACATFGPHHLWQDLGLSGRGDVNRLLHRFLPELIRLNEHDLKWKRFLYAAVGELNGLPDLRPPRCDRCDQFSTCFGR